MEFHVFDTYVKSKQGHVMHFDVVTDESNVSKAILFAKEWLKSVGEENATVSTNECKFCHTESVPDDVEIEIMTNGYFISKLDGCPQ